MCGSYYQKTPTSGSRTLPRVMSAKRPSPCVPHMKHQEPGRAILVGLKGQPTLQDNTVSERQTLVDGPAIYRTQRES